jgi:hypothetical protein
MGGFNMPTKPKSGSKDKGKDHCQTPYYALDPLLPYLNKGWSYWEPAQGKGNIVSRLKHLGFRVYGSDILIGQDFYTWQPETWDCQLTNPPFSHKYRWLHRSYTLKKPFALLMPIDVLGSKKAQALFEKFGIEIILLNQRINYEMPIKKYLGSGAQFTSAWYTFGLNIGQTLTYGKIRYYPNQQMKLKL